MKPLGKFRIVTSVLASAVCLLTAGIASAQQNSMFGNTSSMSSLTSPNGTSAVPGATSSAFGTSASMGMPSMGTPGGVNNTGGQMGMGTSAINQPRGLLGTSNTQNGMLGTAQQGASQGGQGQQNRNQGMNQGNRGQGNQGNRGANRGNNQQQQQQFTNQGGNQKANSQRTIRPQLRVAFDSPRPKAEVTAKNLNSRIISLSKRAGLNGVEVLVEGGKATLRGQVDTEDSRKLAAMLIALEPGVRSVQNDLTVTNPPTPDPGE